MTVPYLDGLVLRVAATASNGVVDGATRLILRQRGARVVGRYSGGSIRRGCLVGSVSGSDFAFRYAQVEASGEIHGGSSSCDLERTPSGLVRIVERFRWRTRDGGGTNVFEECADPTEASG